MSQTLVDEHGGLNVDLFKSLDPDEALIEEIKLE
jgi:hypothetical protein